MIKLWNKQTKKSVSGPKFASWLQWNSSRTTSNVTKLNVEEANLCHNSTCGRLLVVTVSLPHCQRLQLWSKSAYGYLLISSVTSSSIFIQEDSWLFRFVQSAPCGKDQILLSLCKNVNVKPSITWCYLETSANVSSLVLSSCQSKEELMKVLLNSQSQILRQKADWDDDDHSKYSYMRWNNVGQSSKTCLKWLLIEFGDDPKF